METGGQQLDEEEMWGQNDNIKKLENRKAEVYRFRQGQAHLQDNLGEHGNKIRRF